MQTNTITVNGTGIIVSLPRTATAEEARTRMTKIPLTNMTTILSLLHAAGAEGKRGQVNTMAETRTGVILIFPIEIRTRASMVAKTGMVTIGTLVGIVTYQEAGTQ